MRISSTGAIEEDVFSRRSARSRRLAWHPAHGPPCKKTGRSFFTRTHSQGRRYDADAIIRVDYQNDGVIRN